MRRTKGPIVPGQTIGIVGGGQLGRMAAREARRAGYRVTIFTDEPNGSPAGQFADNEINASYFDEDARSLFLRDVSVVTVEFENIPSAFLEHIESRSRLHPSRTAVTTCQNREREKLFLRKHQFPHADFAIVTDATSLADAVHRIGTPCVLKTADFGYDGKGQQKITDATDLAAAWRKLGTSRGVVEQWVDFTAEISVVCARSTSGSLAAFPVAENIHRNHILDVTISPARIDPATTKAATDLAAAIADSLDYVGTLAVEMFLTTSGSILVNEIAPRPHNSGHHTIDSCITSQFQQQIRTVCGFNPGSPRQHSPAVMVNLLGDIWPAPEKHPDWSPVLADPACFLHLYGKRLAKPGRKMGHFTVLGETIDDALARATSLRSSLGLPPLPEA